MNFLAHAHLSFNQPELLVGNMISDFVKGKKKYEYSEGIQHGIDLHRAIDAFTDIHLATKAARLFFKPAVGAYSGAFVDVVYDHFLANDPMEFKHGELLKTAQDTYAVLDQFEKVLPEVFRQMLPYMKAQNWLYHYRTIDGIEKSFGGVAHRAKYLHSAQEVFVLFKNHYQELQNCYQTFFPDVKRFAVDYVEALPMK